MPLSPGTRLGLYEILAPLGAGGMGEVYRARDTKLDREVAIKVLPAALAQDPERLARFEREAKVLASLNHPNIATIHGVEESDGVRALVMELVPGECLKGPLPLETALNYARQIGDALEAAHDKGIVHRDLKPANIMITPQGVVKVLDFGLAYVLNRDREEADPANSPTLTVSPTRAGMILGTASYMSPEQARGKAVDKRADIWAFGVVLYETITGQRLFEGETVSDILAHVLTREPDWKKVPVKVRRLLEACLQKDPRQRLQAIGDWRLLITDVQQLPAASGTRSRLPWALAAAFALALAGLGFLHSREPREEPKVTKTSILPPDKAAYGPASLPSISPDGRHIAFVVVVRGQSGVWIRDLDSLEARLLPGTDGAQYPFWSPDSRFVAFQAGPKLKKVDISGGPVLTLCDSSTNFRGGTWSKEDVILFAPATSDGLYRVPAAGGRPTLATTPNQAREETSDRFPWFLPDGRHFLFTAASQNAAKNTIYVGDLNSKERRPILTAASNAVYAPPGYLLFMREQTLLAQPFDAAALGTTGEAAPVAEQVNFVSGATQGDFSASQNGALVYRSAGATSAMMQLTWMDRNGKAKGTVGAPASVVYAAISPDGATVAASQNEPQTGKRDIWLYDLARGAATRFTLNARQNDSLAWSPDGKYIAFRNWAAGIANLSLKATSGTGSEEILDDTPGIDKFPSDWSNDGRYIVEGRTPYSGARSREDIWLLPRFGDRKPVPYLATEFDERGAKVSPDGQWLAFRSDETKRFELYVSAFPSPQGKSQVSTGSIIGSPIWSRDGREVYFIGADRKMMAVDIKPGAKFEAGVPKVLFEMPQGAGNYFDVGKDGRFLLALPMEQSAAPPMTVVMNWQAGLKK